MTNSALVARRFARRIYFDRSGEEEVWIAAQDGLNAA
jgi:hypothetical protein